MPETDEMQAEPSDAAEGGISREDVRWLFDSLMRVPLWWLVVVSIAVVLSCLTVARAAGGSYIVTFAVTTTAVALLGVMWLPAVIRVLAIVFRKGRLFGFEISGAGMEGFLALIARHKPAGVTFLATQPQIEPEADWPEADFEVPESEAEWEDEDRPKARAIPAWVEAGDRIYEDNRDIFLVHQIRSSRCRGRSKTPTSPARTGSRSCASGCSARRRPVPWRHSRNTARTSSSPTPSSSSSRR
jgi:hypothetical protein